MKRVIAMLLALLLCGVAAAEGMGESLPTWGLTPDEVLAAAQPTDYELESRAGGVQVLEIEHQTFLGWECETDYCFVNGALMAVRIELDDERLAPDSVAEALSERYGEPIEVEVGRVQALLNALSDRSLAGSGALAAGDYLRGWALSDGTYIALTNLLDDDRDELSTLFFDEAALLASADATLSEPAPALDVD